MWPIKQIDFRISREQFEAFSKWIIGKYNLISPQLHAREANVDAYDVLLHDFAINKMSESHLISWSNKGFDKLYNYKLSPGMAVVIHERLAEEGYNHSLSLERFHLQLYKRLSWIFSSSMLDPPDDHLVHRLNA